MNSGRSHRCTAACRGSGSRTRVASSGRVPTRSIRERRSFTVACGSDRWLVGGHPFSCVDDRPPVDQLTDEFPLRLTTGRVLDSYNTGVQSGKFASPIRSGDALELSADDAGSLGLVVGDRVLVSSRRGSIEMTVEVDPDLPWSGVHDIPLSEIADVNQLTSDAWDASSGTSEFKAAAIRVERVEAGA